jgi:hypothetical protein
MGIRLALTPLAFATQPENRKMVEVCMETVFPPQTFLQRLETRVIDLRDRTAIPADEVMVMRVLVQFIRGAPLPQIGLRHQSDLGEQIETPVHCRFIEVGIARSHTAEYLLCSKMRFALAHYGKDAFALRREPMAAGAQRLDHFLMMGHVEFSLSRPYCI